MKVNLSKKKVASTSSNKYNAIRENLSRTQHDKLKVKSNEQQNDEVKHPTKKKHNFLDPKLKSKNYAAKFQEIKR